MITLESPVNATGKTKRLFSDPHEWVNSLSTNRGNLISAICTSIENNGVGSIGMHDINSLSDCIVTAFNLNKKFDDESRTAVRMLLLLTLSKEKKPLFEIKSILLNLVKLISENEEDFDWL